MEDQDASILLNQIYQAATLSRLELIDAAYEGKLIGGGNFPARFQGINDKGQYVVKVEDKEIAITNQTYLGYKKTGSNVTLRVGPGLRRIV